MAARAFDTLRRYLRDLSGRAEPPEDDSLLRRFVEGRDHQAFESLVARHGPMVLGTARRLVDGDHDAEDVFQAVFLSLARLAGTIRQGCTVPAWLHATTYRVAARCRQQNERHPVVAVPSPALEPADHLAWREVRAALDEELQGLPVRWRAPLVLCYLSGLTRDEAARELGWSLGTLKRRLEEGRRSLRLRLERRGIVSAGLALAVLSPDALQAAVHRPLLDTTLGSVLAPAVGVPRGVADLILAPAPASGSRLKGIAMTSTLALVSAVAIGIGIHAGTGRTDPPARAPIIAPGPKEIPTEWREGKAIDVVGGRITSVAYSADGKRIAVGQTFGPEGRATLMNAATHKDRLAIMYPDPASVTTVAFGPSGDRFTMNQKNVVLVLPVAGDTKGEAAKASDLDPHQTAWHTDAGGAEWLAATNGPETVVMKRVNSKFVEQQKAVVGFDIKHRPTPLTFLPKSGRLLFALNDKDAEVQKLEVRISDLTVEQKKGQWLTGHNARPTCAAVSHDESRIVTADEGGRLIVWEGETFREARSVELGEGVVQLALAPDGKTLAVVRAFVDTTLLGLSGRTLNNLEVFVIDASNPPAKPKPLWTARNLLGEKKFTGPASLAFSPDGKTLLAAFADPYIADKDAKSVGVKVWELVPKR